MYIIIIILIEIEWQMQYNDTITMWHIRCVHVVDQYKYDAFISQWHAYTEITSTTVILAHFKKRTTMQRNLNMLHICRTFSL